MSASDKKDFISSVWEFPQDVDTNYSTHGMYRWYGTLPGPLVNRLFHNFTSKDSTILDAFVGAGTSLVEASLLGRDIVGVDVNPLACLVSLVKTTSISPKDVSELGKFDLKKIQKGESLACKRFYSDPKFSYSLKWFNPENLKKLLVIAYRVSHIENTKIRNLGLMTICSLVRSIANVDQRCTHHLVTKLKEEMDVFKLYEEKFEENLELILNFKNLKASIRVVQESSADLSKLKNTKFDFILAHPPYLGVINYYNIHKLSFDLLAWVSQESGTLDFDFCFDSLRSGDLSSDSDERYYIFLKNIIKKFSEKVNANGRVCFITGDSRHKGLLRHSLPELNSTMKEHGFSLEENFIWILNNNSGMHIKRKGNFIDHNYISVFRKTR